MCQQVVGDSAAHVNQRTEQDDLQHELLALCDGPELGTLVRLHAISTGHSSILKEYIKPLGNEKYHLAHRKTL